MTIHAAKTRWLNKTLAMALVGGAILGGETMAQTSTNRRTSNSNRLFVIQSPPVLKTFDSPDPIDGAAPTVGVNQQSQSTEQINRRGATNRFHALPAETAGNVIPGPGRYLVSFPSTVEEIPPPDSLNATLLDDSPVSEMPETSPPKITKKFTNEIVQELNDGEMKNEDLSAKTRKTNDSDRAKFKFEDLNEEDQGEDDDDDAADQDVNRRGPRQFGVWPRRSMQEVRVDVREFSNKVPADESSVLNSSVGSIYRRSGQTEKEFSWAAPNIRFQPLYFEDVAVERYGQTRGLIKQPIVSTFKFFRDAALLPLNAAIDRPYSCDVPLGHGRPGSPTPGCRCQKCQR